jgi:hypothetical protein
VQFIASRYHKAKALTMITSAIEYEHKYIKIQQLRNLMDKFPAVVKVVNNIKWEITGVPKFLQSVMVVLLSQLWTVNCFTGAEELH